MINIAKMDGRGWTIFSGSSGTVDVSKLWQRNYVDTYGETMSADKHKDEIVVNLNHDIEIMKSSGAMGCAKQIKTWIHEARAKHETSHKENIKDAQYTIQPARGGDK